MYDTPYDYEYDLPERDARTWAMMCHLSGLAILVAPPLNLVVPLIIWLAKRDEHPFIYDQGREAVNFQLSMTLYFFGLIFGTIALMIILIGFLLLPFVILALIAIYLLQIVLCVIAAVNANDGRPYRYPFTLRLVS